MPKGSEGDSEEEDDDDESTTSSDGESKPPKGSGGTKSSRGKSKKNPKDDGTEHFDQGKTIVYRALDYILHTKCRTRTNSKSIFFHTTSITNSQRKLRSFEEKFQSLLSSMKLQANVLLKSLSWRIIMN